MPGISSPYIIYKCDTCTRETERQEDSRRPDPLRCTITLNCRGKLFRSGERAAKKFLFPSTTTSLVDWRARGTVVDPSTTSVEVAQISLCTTRTGQGLTIATKNTTASSGSIVLYELTPELVKYKKFFYLINTVVQQIRGVDDSADRNTLRFISTEKVKVFVNGVELESFQFDRSIDNEITFTPMITTINNLIEVVVYDDISNTITEENTIRLPIIRMIASDTRRSNFTWGDTSSIEIFNESYSLMFCLDINKLIQGQSYGFVGIELMDNNVSTLVDPTSVKFVLGKFPFTNNDAELFAYGAVDTFIDDQVISYKTSTTSTALELTVSEDAITQIATPILRNVINIVATDDIPVSSTLSQGTVTLKRKFTLGPT